MVAQRISLQEYSNRLTTECNRVYDIVKIAKSRGFDPKMEIEIPQAVDLSERVQKLLKFLHDRNTAQQIRELTTVHDENRELVALDIARIVCAESYLYGIKETCSTCGGEGRVVRQARVGPFVQQMVSDCPDCDGHGKIIRNPCSDCHGSGTEKREQKLRMRIPQGAEDGLRLRQRGKGQHILNGQSGDLYIQLEVEPHTWFERDGPDLIMALPLGYPEMMLGTQVELPHVDGKTLIIDVPAGSKPSETLVVRGRGMPSRRGRGRGDVTILLKLHVPEKIDKSMRSTLEEMRASFGLPPNDVEDAVRREAEDRRN